MTDNYQPGYDLRFDPLPEQWQRDLATGEYGERTVAKVVGAFRDCPADTEVKLERKNNGKHFIETCQRSRNGGQWRKSGLLTTEATWWWVVVMEPAVSLKVYAVQDLRQLHEFGLLGSEIPGGPNSRGHCLRFEDIDKRIEDYLRPNKGEKSE